MNEQKETGAEIKKQVVVFYEKKLPLHVELTDGSYYNGKITEVSADFFMMAEIKVGPIPIFFIQINKIAAYRPKEIKGEGNVSGN